MDALEELSKAMQSIPKNKKIVLFFDELPWMATDKIFLGVKNNFVIRKQNV
jgi:hypothetical protein